MTTYKVWVEIEELDDKGDFARDWSAYLDDGAVGVFDDLDEAVAFGNQVQRLTQAWLEVKT